MIPAAARSPRSAPRETRLPAAAERCRPDARTGRLTKDPELREVGEQTKVCQLRLAVDGMGRAGARGGPRCGDVLLPDLQRAHHC
jgi:hypothetical protein